MTPYLPCTAQDCDTIKQYKSALTSSFRTHLGKDKISHGLTQEALASIFSVSSRSVAELTAGRNGPSGLTLALYLVYLCDDTAGFIHDLKGAFDEVLPDWPRQEQRKQRRTRRGPVKDGYLAARKKPPPEVPVPTAAKENDLWLL